MTDISSMTDSELNEALAEWRGWHKRQTGTGYPWYWCEPDYMEDSLYRHSGKSVMMCSEWHPCVDLNQAVECAEKFCKDREFCYWTDFGVSNGEYWYRVWITGSLPKANYSKTLARALCEAVLMAKRGEG